MTLTEKRKYMIDRYSKDVLDSASKNHIWLNAMACINPTDEFKIGLAEEILEMLDRESATILSDWDGTPFEDLKQLELIVRINKS